MTPNPLHQFRDDTALREDERARYERLLRERVAALDEPRASWTTLWWGAGALAAAAAALLVVRGVGPAEPQPLAMQLEGPAAQATLTEHVRVSYAGEARVSGTDRAPLIELGSGRVEVDVDHGQGIDLRVRTPEAEVRVLGTVFSVERGPLGSEVRVSRGRVGVVCADGSQLELEVGQTHTCLPTDASGLLGRARALQSAGAPAEQVLAAVDAGLGQVGDDAAARGELLYVRLEALSAAQQFGPALEAAQAYLDSGEQSRRVDALEAAARLGLLSGGCADIEPRLAELEAGGHAARTAELRTRCPRE